MDVRDMGFFMDDSFDSVIDKGINFSLPFIQFEYYSNLKVVQVGISLDFINSENNLKFMLQLKKTSWYSEILKLQ